MKDQIKVILPAALIPTNAIVRKLLEHIDIRYQEKLQFIQIKTLYLK